ncbi:hypothetical protein [Aurantiacibacter suaedae]|uniref:hypothetical protein n=1 Tax=Aurantiacibacter suaedae TaxID=2545755 RepID=UPI0010F9FA11|nr:hypothetical protein [Aurantiacibacter suaedae]
MKIRKAVSALTLAFYPILSVTGAAPASAQEPQPPQIAEADGSGAYPATFVGLPSLPNHVVYMPRDLSVVKKNALPVYVYGNGGCSADGLSSRNHLLEIASHGYIAIAPGVIPGPNREIPVPRQLESGLLSADTPSSALGEAIDWILEQNSREDSPLAGLVATDKIAVSGWSCGGLQALINAGDARVTTTIIMFSGIFNNEVSPIAGMEANKSLLDELHGPTLYVLGGPEDGAQPNGLDDFGRIEGLPAALVDIPVGHGGTFHEVDGGVGSEVVVKWLDWVLKNDAEAAAYYRGDDCGFCEDDRFKLLRKNID